MFRSKNLVFYEFYMDDFQCFVLCFIYNYINKSFWRVLLILLEILHFLNYFLQMLDGSIEVLKWIHINVLIGCNGDFDVISCN